MKRHLIAIGACLACLAVSACQSSGAEHVRVIAPPVSSLDELASLSVEARHELRLLALAQEAVARQEMSAQQQEERFRQATYVPPGFDQSVQFNFTGPASEAAKAIAMLAGYELSYEGAPLASEPFVRIQVDGQPLNEALRELGAQTGSVIRVEVFPAASLMRFVYVP